MAAGGHRGQPHQATVPRGKSQGKIPLATGKTTRGKTHIEKWAVANGRFMGMGTQLFGKWKCLSLIRSSGIEVRISWYQLFAVDVLGCNDPPAKSVSLFGGSSGNSNLSSTDKRLARWDLGQRVGHRQGCIVSMYVF